MIDSRRQVYLQYTGIGGRYVRYNEHYILDVMFILMWILFQTIIIQFA